MIHAALAEQIACHTQGDDIVETAIPRLSLIRWSHAAIPVHTFLRPALCIIAQGAKQILLGDAVIAYDPSHYLVASLDLPITGVLTEASAEAPYLCFCLDLDLNILSDLLVKTPPAAASQDGDFGLSLYPATEAIVDAATRLTSLLSAPQDAAILAPLVERELLFRLITGPAGGLIRAIATGESRVAQISRAIVWLKTHFRERFNGAALARMAGMSLSGFHDHFRRATAMTPLQYQRRLRLQESRRLMMTTGITAAEAGDQVGFGSPSQFSREYRRLFGAPPHRDVTTLRGTIGPTSNI